MADLDLIAGTDSPFAPWVVEAVRELRTSEREAREVLAKVRSWHGNSIDPDECMECDDKATSGQRPCRTAEQIDAFLASVAEPTHAPVTHEQVYNAWHGRPLDAGWGGCDQKEAVGRVMDLIAGRPVKVSGCARCEWGDHGEGREAHVDGAGLVIG